jgi:hypothetical protein
MCRFLRREHKNGDFLSHQGTEAQRDLKSKDISRRAFVPPWETFSQQRESQGFHAKDVVEKFRSFSNDSLRFSSQIGFIHCITKHDAIIRT